MNLLKLGSDTSSGQTLDRRETRQPGNRVSRGSSDRQSKDLIRKIQEIAVVEIFFAGKFRNDGNGIW
jgi:hypothetical protein